MIDGYRWVGRPAKRGSYIVGPDNKRISRRQYENIKWRKYGWSSWSQYQHYAKTRQYKFWLKEAELEHGIKPAFLKKPNSKFHKLFLAAKKSDWDKSPDSDFHKLLVYLGLRDRDADWDIGDSP